jgi:hypothetical protein
MKEDQLSLKHQTTFIAPSVLIGRNVALEQMLSSKREISFE